MDAVLIATSPKKRHSGAFSKEHPKHFHFHFNHFGVLGRDETRCDPFLNETGKWKRKGKKRNSSAVKKPQTRKLSLSAARLILAILCSATLPASRPAKKRRFALIIFNYARSRGSGKSSPVYKLNLITRRKAIKLEVIPYRADSN
jgi:hypothetical protein